VLTSDLGQEVFQGQLLPPVYYTSSGEEVSLADFTLLTEPGEYVLVVDDLGKSVPFRINENVFVNLSKALVKAFYYNRASTPIESEFAGVYARAEGHPDTAVIVLPSAASENRPAGTKISTPGGWYDAGDYNKYIVSSGGTIFDLLSAYETYPAFYDTLSLNIPESNNNIPDILDEALWNIKWMMTMQDEDGGVYNKTTEANFSGFVMPSEVTATRYVTAKGTAATLDFAAVMAMTARIYKKYDAELANRALLQAEKAWQWAKANPNVAFNNPAASGNYPAINTGGYGDSDFTDEFWWCAAEL
jgi:endoglucanase